MLWDYWYSWKSGYYEVDMLDLILFKSFVKLNGSCKYIAYIIC